MWLSGMSETSHIGVVIIGRNEGARLVRCLNSCAGKRTKIVYVDSGSADDSVNVASGMGADIVSLDLKIPFTAARARNAGFERLRAIYPEVIYVQFIDGDCELVGGWLVTAAAFLDGHKSMAMVCGRLRERHPEHSIYNLLCDIEWDTEIGLSKACGGIAMARVDAIAVVGGFRASLIAGEEPELCIRLRAIGMQIWRLDAEMALHDAAITRFGQWWKRSRRSGYAYAEGAYLHGKSPERHWVKESRRALLWGLGVPALLASLTVLWGGWALTGLVIYPAQVSRIALLGERSGPTNWWLALFLVLGKFPEAMGQLNFFYNRLAGKTARLIEYK